MFDPFDPDESPEETHTSQSSEFLKDWGRMLAECGHCGPEERHEILKEAISAFFHATPSLALPHYEMFLDAVGAWSEAAQHSFFERNVAFVLPGFAQATLLFFEGIHLPTLVEESRQMLEGQVQLRAMGLLPEPNPRAFGER